MNDLRSQKFAFRCSLVIALTAGLIAGLTAGPAVAVAAQAPQTIDIAAGSGSAIHASLWSLDPASPALLLLSECDGDRDNYDTLGAALANVGFRVLSIDAREKSTSDELAAALRYLANAEPGAIGALGAGCGGSKLLDLAKTHPELRLLGLLSAPLNQLELRDALQLPSTAMLLVVAKGDRAANPPAATLAYRRQEETRLFLYEGDARGAALLEQEPELAQRIADWFSAHR